MKKVQKPSEEGGIVLPNIKSTKKICDELLKNDNTEILTERMKEIINELKVLNKNSEEILERITPPKLW